MRTKNQIKIDRFFSVLIGGIGLFGLGYYSAMESPTKAIICFIATLFLIRMDKCNNDLEYGRYKHDANQEKSEVEE